jgi:hypothetical protein
MTSKKKKNYSSLNVKCLALHYIQWTVSDYLGEGFQAIRMVNNVELNVDASFREEKFGCGGIVHDPTSSSCVQ